MNIFILDEDPKVAARMQCDKHVVKMIVESAQMLCTTHRYLDGKEWIDRSKNGRKITRWSHWTDPPKASNHPVLYKSVMIKHPCTIWTCKSLENYDWHTEHALELCAEYTRRYGKTHATERLIQWCKKYIPMNWNERQTSKGLTPFAQAMPDHYKVSGDAVQAYRNYYIGDKARFAKWKESSLVPEWFSQGVLELSSASAI